MIKAKALNYFLQILKTKLLLETKNVRLPSKLEVYGGRGRHLKNVKLNHVLHNEDF